MIIVYWLLSKIPWYASDGKISSVVKTTNLFFTVHILQSFKLETLTNVFLKCISSPLTYSLNCGDPLNCLLLSWFYFQFTILIMVLVTLAYTYCNLKVRARGERSVQATVSNRHKRNSWFESVTPTLVITWPIMTSLFSKTEWKYIAKIPFHLL